MPLTLPFHRPYAMASGPVDTPVIARAGCSARWSRMHIARFEGHGDPASLIPSLGNCSRTSTRPMPVTCRLSRRAANAASQPISFLMHLALSRPELISLAAGFVDQESLPVDETRTAVLKLLADATRARAALQYGTNAGYLPLRGRVRTISDGRRPQRAPAADRRPGGAHRRQQPDAAPGGRGAARSGRHRAVRRADLLRVPGIARPAWAAARSAWRSTRRA